MKRRGILGGMAAMPLVSKEAMNPPPATPTVFISGGCDAPVRTPELLARRTLEKEFALKDYSKRRLTHICIPQDLEALRSMSPAAKRFAALRRLEVEEEALRKQYFGVRNLLPYSIRNMLWPELEYED